MKAFFPTNRQGIVIDVIVVACNLLIFPLFAARVGNLFNESFADNSQAFMTLAGVMLFILAGRLIGLYLKRFPLQARLADSADGSFPLVFFIFSVPLIILTAAFVMVLFSAISADVGLTDAGVGGAPKESRAVAYLGTLLIFVLTAAEGYLLYKLGKPLNDHEKEMRSRGIWIYSPVAELLADFGLFAYMMIWQVFYHQVAETLLLSPDGRPVPADMKIISIFFLAVSFILFYVAPRAVFLIEDRKYWGTWLLITLVFLSSIVRYWF